MRPAIPAALAVMIALGVPARAAADLGLGAMLTLDGTISHGGGVGTTLHLEAHQALTSVRASLMAGNLASLVVEDEGTGDTKNIAGGMLLAPTLGIRQVLFQDDEGLQPWLAAGLGYGWFWFDQEDLDFGRLGIDSRRAAWYVEAGFDLSPTGRGSGFGKSFSVRGLSSPVGILWFASFAAFWDDRS